MFPPGQGPNLYRDQNNQRAYLDPGIYNLVIMGHTHKALWKPIPNYPDKLYVNTGTWTTETIDKKTSPKRTTFATKTERMVVLVEQKVNKEVWVRRGIIKEDGDFVFLNQDQDIKKWHLN